jgi:hypothetical protein
MLDFNLYCKNATGGDIVYSCIGKTVGKICNAGIVRENGNGIKFVVDLGYNFIKSLS